MRPLVRPRALTLETSGIDLTAARDVRHFLFVRAARVGLHGSVLKIGARLLVACPLTLIASALAVAVQGCGCSDEARAGLSISVIDASTGGRICDATVVATDGSYSETLVAVGGSGSCEYVGATERAGTYDLAVSSGSRTASATHVVVPNGTCHVTTQMVSVTLP